MNRERIVATIRDRLVYVKAGHGRAVVVVAHQHRIERLHSATSKASPSAPTTSRFIRPRN